MRLDEWCKKYNVTATSTLYGQMLEFIQAPNGEDNLKLMELESLEDFKINNKVVVNRVCIISLHPVQRKRKGPVPGSKPSKAIGILKAVSPEGFCQSVYARKQKQKERKACRQEGKS
jgi:hypothetical protein